MSELYLLANAECPAKIPSDALVAVWDRGSVPDGYISIPAELNARILSIRAELSAWTYELGKVPCLGEKTVEELLRAGDPLSMYWLSTLFEKHPKVTSHLFQALKLRVLEQIMDEHGITGLILVAAPTIEPYVPSVLKKFCIDTARYFDHLQAKPIKPAPAKTFRDRLAGFYYSLPAPLKAMGRFPVWLWTNRRPLPHTKDKRPSVENPATVVTYFPNIDLDLARKEGRFRSRYWENLHDLLEGRDGKSSRINWVFLYFRSPQCTRQEAIELRNLFRESNRDGASFHFLEEFLSFGDIVLSLLRFIWISWWGVEIEDTVSKNFHFKGSRINLWPVLKGNWADSTRGWRGLERCLMRRAFSGYAKWAGKQEWTIFPQENCPWERMLAQAMHEHNAGPVYGAQHSTVRPTDFRYFDDPRMFTEPSCKQAMLDLWLSNGTAAREAVLANGMPPERNRVVEALRYLYMAGLPAAECGKNDTPEAPGEVRTDGAKGTEALHGKLLVVTSFFEDETEAHLTTLADAARKGVLDGWDVVVKPHPYLPVAERLKELYGEREVPQLGDGAIGNFLKPGTVVWASNSTTVALEAAHIGLPVMVQAAENDVDLCPLQNMPGIVTVRTAADVAAALAAPRSPQLPPNSLALDTELPRWKEVLGMK